MLPHSRLITGFVTRLTRWVPPVEQELLTLPKHLSSPQVFNGVRVPRSLVLCVCFVLLYFFFWPLRCLFFINVWILITQTNQPHRICLSHVYNHVRNKNMMQIVLELRNIIYQLHISANKPYNFICNFQRCITKPGAHPRRIGDRLV
jgi:hypothetical protein